MLDKERLEALEAELEAVEELTEEESPFLTKRQRLIKWILSESESSHPMAATPSRRKEEYRCPTRSAWRLSRPSWRPLRS